MVLRGISVLQGGAYAGSECLSKDRALTPGSAIGMYRLYDAGREVERRVFCCGQSSLRRAARTLSRAAFLKLDGRSGRRIGSAHRHGVLEPVQDLIGRVLQTGVGLVQLTGGLGRQLAQLVAVLNVSQSSKDKV